MSQPEPEYKIIECWRHKDMFQVVDGDAVYVTCQTKEKCEKWIEQQRISYGYISGS